MGCNSNGQTPPRLLFPLPTLASLLLSNPNPPQVLKFHMLPTEPRTRWGTTGDASILSDLRLPHAEGGPIRFENC